MSEERGSIGTPLLIFLAGAAVGAAIVALTTPKSGVELRGDLKDLGGKVKDRISRLRANEEDKVEV
jgi:gas vesicle protein